MRNDLALYINQIPWMPQRKQIWYARQWIARKGLRQSDVVARTEFTKSMVSEYLSGKRRWNEDVLAAFAHALGLEPVDLLRPPDAPPDEFTAYVLKLDAKKRRLALRILRAAIGEEDVA